MGIATLIFSSVIAANSVSPMLTVENYPSMQACQIVLNKVADQQFRVLSVSTTGPHKPQIELVDGSPNRIRLVTGIGRIMAEVECVDLSKTASTAATATEKTP